MIFSKADSSRNLSSSGTAMSSTIRKRSCALVAMEAQIQSVEDCASGGHTKEGFEMRILVPKHCGDAVAAFDAQPCESFRETARSIVEGTIAGAHESAVRAAGYDFNVGELFAGALEERGEQERVVHHGPVHVTPLGNGRPAADTITFDVGKRDLAGRASESESRRRRLAHRMMPVRGRA